VVTALAVLRGLALPSQVPVDIGRDAARDAARAELAKQVYQDQRPGPVQRLFTWFADKLLGLLERAAGVTPGGLVGLILIAALVVLVVVVILLRTGPLARNAGSMPLFTGRSRTADEHRRDAEAHAAAGRWAEAVRERMRAIVRGLEERALIDERPGRTADEAASEAGAALPDCAAGLRTSARVFDDVWYGGHPADATSYATVRDTDEKVRAARRVLGGRR
jgi:uncharacterized protein DUF4129